MKKCVAIVSPAGPVNQHEIECGIIALQQAGFNVKLFPHVYDHFGEYLAGSDYERAADLTSAWLDPNIDWICCSRGGYGCARILPLLDWKLLATRNIPVCGFSDITALHWAMTRFNIGTPVAGPMVIHWGKMDNTTKWEVLLAIEGKQHIQSQWLMGFHGQPLAGNLMVAASLAGTPYFPDTTGKIIILEEVNESAYRIDRALNQLRQIGAFDSCSALLFGKFTNCDDADKVLHDFANTVPCPVRFGIEFGHELPMHSFNFHISS